jgi:hypothetical protein
VLSCLVLLQSRLRQTLSLLEPYREQLDSSNFCHALFVQDQLLLNDASMPGSPLQRLAR